MNPLIKNIAEKASQDLLNLIEEGEQDIIAAIHKMEEEAQLQETAPKFGLGFKITVDLDKSTFDCQLSWTLKQSLSASHKIEDPNQPKLPLENESSEGSIRIKTASGIDTGDVPMSTMKAALKVLKRKNGGKK